MYKILSSLTTRDTAPVRRKERGEEREKREREILKSPTRSCVGRGKLRKSEWVVVGRISGKLERDVTICDDFSRNEEKPKRTEKTKEGKFCSKISRDSRAKRA